MAKTTDDPMAAFLADALGPEDWAERAWAEARERCEECRRRDDAFAEARAQEAWLDPARWPGRIERRERPPRPVREAVADLERLRDVPTGSRVAAFDRALRGLDAPGLAEHLLAEGRNQPPEKAAEAREWLDCAETAAHREPEGDERARRLLRIEAERAHVLRFLGELAAAAEAWGHLRERLARQPLDGPAEEARFWVQAAGCQAARREFPAAAALLDRAERLRRLAGDSAGAAETRTARGDLAERAGAPRTAVAWYLRAAAALDPAAEPRRFCVNQTGLAASLVATGDAAGAARVVQASEAILRRVSDVTLRRRRTWIQGRIALAAGRWEEAEAKLRRVREDCRNLRRVHEVALVQLDLARLGLAAGLPTQVREAAAGLAPLLRTDRISPRLAEALRDFQTQAAAGRADAALLADLIRYVPLVRRDPAYPFRRGETLTPPPPPPDDAS